MRKTIFGFIFLIFCFGCASTQVTENLFVSKNPDLSVLVEPAFKYIGTNKGRWGQDSVGNMKFLNYEEESSFFIKEKSGEKIGKSILILSIQKVETQYTIDLFPKIVKHLENDMTTLGNDKYQYITQIEYPTTKNHKMRWLKDNGIIFPTCVILKRHARAVYPNTLMVIEYLEELPDGGDRCHNWLNKDFFKDDQKEFVKLFSKRAQDSFKFVGYIENHIQTQSPQKSLKEGWSEATEKIKALGELLEKKLITQEEYDQKKKNLLEQF